MKVRLDNFSSKLKSEEGTVKISPDRIGLKKIGGKKKSKAMLHPSFIRNKGEIARRLS